jgi:hypothetical protein
MHLENESLEMLLSREFSRKGVDFSHKKRLAQSHRVRGMLDRMRTNAQKLVRSFSLVLALSLTSFSYSLQQNLVIVLFYASSSSDICVIKERTTRV